MTPPDSTPSRAAVAPWAPEMATDTESGGAAAVGDVWPPRRKAVARQTIKTRHTGNGAGFLKEIPPKDSDSAAPRLSFVSLPAEPFTSHG